MGHNYFEARSRALLPLHRAIDDYLPTLPPNFTLVHFSVIALVTGIAATGLVGVGAAFISAGTIQSQASATAEQLANSTYMAAQEELCVWVPRGDFVDWLCSPSFDKGRRPEGKLITGRLPEVPNAPTSVAFITPPPLTLPGPDPRGQIMPDEGMQVDEYSTDFPIYQQLTAFGYHLLPSQAPDNLRERRFSSAVPNLNPKAKVIPVKVAVPLWQRCKPRSYWSVKHKECRRKR